MRVEIKFEDKRLLMIVEGASLDTLRGIGAYMRKIAQNSVFQSKRPSVPGRPPNTREGVLQNSLLFGVEKNRKSVVIGPAASFIGQVMTAHEYGGAFRGQKYPERPLMAPILRKTLPQLPQFFQNIIK